jgi:hypothetical protein
MAVLPYVAVNDPNTFPSPKLTPAACVATFENTHPITLHCAPGSPMISAAALSTNIPFSILTVLMLTLITAPFDGFTIPEKTQFPITGTWSAGPRE